MAQDKIAAHSHFVRRHFARPAARFAAIAARIAAIAAIALGAALPAGATFVADGCQGCHGVLATLPNGSGLSGAIKAANNPAYLKLKIQASMGSLLIANFNDAHIQALASEIAAGAPVSAAGITSAAPAGGTRGTAYTHSYVTTGAPNPQLDIGMGSVGSGTIASSPAAFTITSGGLPTGLTLDNVNGVISGTPTQGGTFACTMSVTNNIGAAATQTCTITIAKNATTTTVATSGTPSTYGGSVTFTATVAGTTTAPTGTVTFTDGATNLGSFALSAFTSTTSRVTLTTSALTATTHAIIATYSGDTNYNASASGPLSQVVNKVTPAATLSRTVGAASVAFGTSLTFQASVPASGGGALPTGTVQFKDGAANLGSAVTLSAGTASLVTSALAVSGSPHSITAVYSGDGNYNTVTPTAVSQTVTQATSSTSVALAAGGGSNPSTFGSSVTVQATVSAPAGATGTVQFQDNGVNVGSPVAVSGGIAQLALPSLSIGSHPITAVYSGDANVTGSTSAAFTQTVNKGNSTTTVTRTAGVSPSTFGASLTFQAAVAVPVGTATGTVQFKDNGVNIGSPVTLSAGAASLTVSNLAVATHPITATYSGDASFNGSSDAVGVTQVVNKATPTLGTITSTVNPSLSAQSITLSVSVTSAVGTPTGTVQFKDGAVNLGAPITLSAGTASLTTTAITTSGAHAITAVYSGDASFNTATSAPFTQVISQGLAATIAPTTNPPGFASTFGQSVTFTAVVSGASGTPTGFVAFKDGATTLGTIALTAGSAQFTTSALTVGSHAITFAYAGDATYAPTTGASPYSFLVSGLPQSINFTSTPPVGAKAGDPNYTVTATGGASGNPVVFSVHATSSAGACSVTGASVSLVKAGTCVIAADQAGGGNYQAAPTATQSFAIAVNPAQSANLSVTQSASTATPATGKDVMYTVTVANAGPVAATGVVLTDLIPPGTNFIWASPGCANNSGTVTCTIGALASGASSVAKIVVRPVVAATLTNTASVAGNEPDVNTANNTANHVSTSSLSPVGAQVQRYRLFSPVTNEHLYTTDLNEYNVLGSFVGTWVQEGPVGKVLNNPGTLAGTAATPYYRLYNTSNAQHHWTTDPNEYYTLILFPQYSGEGVDGYIFPTQATGTVPLYRLLYPFTVPVAGLHHWTIDAAEYNALIASFGWIGEGGSGFVIP